LVIEGTGIRTRDGAVGFFTTRSVKQPSAQAAELYVLRVLREEWRRGVSAGLSPTKPLLRMIDIWRPTLLERLRRQPDTAQSFYNTGERAEAARAEAAAIRAPVRAALRTIGGHTPA